MSDFQSLPDCPEIGWGPGVEAERAGLTVQSHKQSIIDTKTGEVELRFDLKQPKAVLQNMRSNHFDEWLLNRHAVVKVQDGQLVVNVRLPENGEYALKLFTDDLDHEGDMSNVCNYLIRCLGKNIKPNPFPKLHEGALGIDAVTHKSGTILTSDGKLNVKFVKQKDLELYCELDHNGVDKAELSNLTQTKDDGKVTTFDVALPKKGEYAMNIFARQKGDNIRLYHVHTYLIESEQTLE